MAKTIALVFGSIFVLVGLLGFVSNPLVGSVGLFMTDSLHNLVHLVIGAILLFAARAGQGQSSMWLKIIGVVYLALAVLGFLLAPAGPTLLGLVEVNAWDNWLHLVAGLVLVFAGWRGNSPSMQPAAPMA